MYEAVLLLVALVLIAFGADHAVRFTLRFLLNPIRRYRVLKQKIVKQDIERLLGYVKVPLRTLREIAASPSRPVPTPYQVCPGWRLEARQRVVVVRTHTRLGRHILMARKAVRLWEEGHISPSLLARELGRSLR